MKKIYVYSLMVFVFSLAVYGAYEIYGRLSTDTTIPIIELESQQIEVSIKDGEEALIKGVSAYDEKDGDISDTVIVESMSRFIDGVRIITYVAFDKDNHVGKATREVVYSDYKSPVFSSTTGFRFPMRSDSLIEGLRAEDCIEGDITSQVKVSPGFYVDTYETGLYGIQYQVANKSGDVEYLPITVEIYDPAVEARSPKIELNNYIVYTTVGKKVDAASYIKEATIGSLEVTKADVTIDASEVNYNEPGVYEITYSLRSGENSGTNRLVVVVR